MPDSRSAFDVDGLVIRPAYRATPWAAAQAAGSGTGRNQKARILILGECNVCRSVLAECLLRQALDARGLTDAVEVASAATRDYCLGT